MIKTKIIATVGPSSNKKAMLKKLIESGMNVARLNFSHGSSEEHAEVIKRIRSISRVMNRPVGILLDLQGPKIRTGKLKNGEPVVLEEGGTFKITPKKIEGSAEMVSTTYKKLTEDVKKGDKILLDDGLIELRVMSKYKGVVKCQVVNGGILKESKGINLPGVNVSAPSLTEKDRRDLNFGIQNKVDYFALSFVRTADDLKKIKGIIKRQGSDIPVIAKIEKPEAVENLDSILEAADAIMVARGDLGVEMNPEYVPHIQKHIINAAIKQNKLVITATQMLESMINNPIPTRAEASDVANAIFDGTDAVMLSGETAAGRYPVEAVRMMAKIARQAEGSPFMKYNLQHGEDRSGEERSRDERSGDKRSGDERSGEGRSGLVARAVARSAVSILHELNAKGIVVFSVSGSTSKLVSRQRPVAPVYVFTPRMEVYNRLSLVWGVTPLYISDIEDAKRLVKASENILVNKKIAKKNQLIIIVIGLGLREGSTNVIKIHRIGRED
ncbi:MAG: pyruvate kinase [Desulfobacterales bacterium]|nr:pyruvate kinase [Desulfobacterales bacterium]